MLLGASVRSVSLDALHLVNQDVRSAVDLSASAESLNSCSPAVIGHRRSADGGYGLGLTAAPGIVVTPPPPQCGVFRDHHRKNEVTRAAWEVSNRYERRSHAARQQALRHAAILHMRKNSAALQMAGMERSASPCSEPDVTQLRDRLTALDLQLQETSAHAQEQLSHLHCSREQHLQLLRELSELGHSDDLPDQFPGGDADGELLATSLPCLSLPPPASPKAKKLDKMAGLKKVAIGTAWGRVLSSKLQKPPIPSKPPTGPPLPPPHPSPTSSARTGKRGSSQFYAPLLDVPQKRSPSLPNVDVSFLTPCLPMTSKTSFGCSADSDGEEEAVAHSEISPEALAEIAAFKQLIDAYFANYISSQPIDFEHLFS
ncbi:hypothetical protein FHG87_012616 [Trinorchestia longiramus]|nr:hypothetical protein FHG87_012616 [Trinorchestia longiramus]